MKNTAPQHRTRQTADLNSHSKTVGVVPLGFTIGLCLATLILSGAGYGFRLMFDDEPSAVLRHALVVMPVFVIGIPLLTWLGSFGLNKLGKTAIHPRNALTFGWLLSTVALLSIMGIYS